MEKYQYSFPIQAHTRTYYYYLIKSQAQRHDLFQKCSTFLLNSLITGTNKKKPPPVNHYKPHEKAVFSQVFAIF